MTLAVTKVWSSGEVLTHTDLNQNFDDVEAMFDAGGVPRASLATPYAPFFMTFQPSDFSGSEDVSMKFTLEAGIALVVTRVTLHCVTGTGSLDLYLRYGGTPTEVINEAGNKITVDANDEETVTETFVGGGAIPAGSQVILRFNETGATTVADVTATVQGKVYLRS